MARDGAPARRSHGRPLHLRALSPELHPEPRGETTAALDWLNARTAAAPAQLRDRVIALAAASRNAGDPADVLADAAIAALERLLAKGDHTRAIAHDLLAVDALVTCACQAAIERWEESSAQPAELIGWCESLAVRIADTRNAAG